MADDLTANDLIGVGTQLTFLHNPQNASGNDYRNAINTFVERVRRCGFPATLAAAKAIENCIFYTDSVSGFVHRDSIHPLKFAVHSIDSCLRTEASQKTVILSDVQPPEQLNRLGSLEPHQDALRSDLVTCLKARLARPAIVVAWALCYDIVRQWVCNEGSRLDAFNAQIKHAPLNDNTALFAMGERRVLDACKNAQEALKNFNVNTHHELVGLLNDRNRFAHANFSEATINRANVFVEKMVETVTGPPFR